MLLAPGLAQAVYVQPGNMRVTGFFEAHEYRSSASDGEWIQRLPNNTTAVDPGLEPASESGLYTYNDYLYFYENQVDRGRMASMDDIPANSTELSVDTSNFDNNLPNSSAADTVQKVLDLVDDLTLGTGSSKPPVELITTTDTTVATTDMSGTVYVNDSDTDKRFLVDGVAADDTFSISNPFHNKENLVCIDSGDQFVKSDGSLATAGLPMYTDTVGAYATFTALDDVRVLPNIANGVWLFAADATGCAVSGNCDSCNTGNDGIIHEDSTLTLQDTTSTTTQWGATKFTIAADSCITKISANIYDQGASVEVELAIYSHDSGNDEPNASMGAGYHVSLTNITDTAAENVGTLAATQELPIGTYWKVLIPVSGSVTISTDNDGGGDLNKYSNDSGSTWNNSSVDRDFKVYGCAQ